MEKLKQKVASSSSRVIASLQQAATGTFQIPSQQQQQQQQHQTQDQANPAAGIHQNQAQATKHDLGPGSGSRILMGPSKGQQLEPASAFNDDPLLPARLVAAGATAHLTREEQEILLQVFKKEEQFQRDTINQMSHQSIRSPPPPPAANHNPRRQLDNSGPRAAGGMVTGKENRKSSATQQNQSSRSNRQTVTANTHSSFYSSQYSTASLSGAESVTASGANSPFTSARSTTPLSSQQHQQRAQSSCSNGSSLASGSNHATNNTAGSATLTTPMGQCRICRKSIFANETCHLCSACNQFVCEDCGSYSASDQHWMCSSCRRRATKPAIPADALKELGLNQNSSAVRRMTLRLNQADLKQALGKGSSESSASSSSSSGCSSSQSMATNKAQQQQQHINDPNAAQLNLKRTQGRKQPAAATAEAATKADETKQLARTRAAKQEPEPEVGGGSKAKSLRGLAGQKMERTSRAQQPVVGQRAIVSGLDVNNNDHHHKQPQPQQQQQNHLGPSKQQQQQQLALQAHPVGGQIMMVQACYDGRGAPGDGLGQRQGSVEVQRKQQQQFYHQYQRRSSAVACGGDLRAGAQKTLSQPARGGASGGRQRDFVTDMEHGPGGEHANKADPRNRPTARTMPHEPEAGGQVRQHEQQQQPLSRRASVASPEHVGGVWTGSGSGASGGQTAVHWRQQSGSIFAQNNNPNCLQPAYQGHEPQSSGSMTSIPRQQQQQQQFVQPQTMVTASSDASLDGGGYCGEQFGGPAAAAAAADVPRFRHGSLTTINTLQQHHHPTSVPMSMSTPFPGPNQVQVEDQDMLVPMPSEQMMHVRRLSDQSNLIRRSSVVSEILMGGISGAQRIRSHSNIDNMDTFPCHFPPDFQAPRPQPTNPLSQQQQQQQATATSHTGFTNWMPQQHHQQQQQSARPTNNNNTNFRGMSTDDSTTFGAFEGHKLNVAGYASQQRRPSDQWVLQQHVAAQQEALAYTAKEYQSAAAPQPGANRMSSIITPYAQKRRQASEEMNSDSSSDIEETGADLQRGSMEFDNNDQPSEYFAPPAIMSSYDHDYMMGYQQQQQHHHQYPQYQHTIPSVSVSEFNSSQQRLNQMNNSQQNQIHEMYQQSNNLAQQMSGAYDQIMTTPMEVNLAIEQAIQQQQQQHQQQRRLSNEYLASNSYLLPRRGSSGRVLPKVPGEQSRSLLDLPCNVHEQQQHDQQQQQQRNGLASGSTERAGSRGQLSTLDLPCPTIRRASAPEGQNIRIVVDDMDEASMMMIQMVGPYGRKQSKQLINGAKGELYERLVLYRDDTLDPNASMAHGFGLQVMGGKMDDEAKKLQAFVSWILPGGPADKVGLKQGDRIIEWDGKCLVNMSYEQVADVIESSANIAELLVKPAQRLDAQPGLNNLVRSQRRMSQQTERDLKRIQQTTNGTTSGRRMSSMGHQQASSDRRDSLRMYSSSTVSINHQRQQDGCGQYSHGVGSAAATTRRRLPQIPGLNQEGDQVYYQQQQPSRDGHSSSMVMTTTATGQNNYGLLSAVASNYNPQQQQQHSVSTSELYQSRGVPQNTISASSIGVLSHPSASQATWQGVNSNHNGQLDGSHMAQPSQQPAPGTHLSPSGDVCGLIGLQVNVDERLPQLEVSVLNAINIVKNPGLEYYVRVRILPESKRFKACTTQPSCDMNWKETFIFQNFPIQQIQRMALEIGIWIHDEAPRLSAYGAQPLCEALIPIHGAAERNTDFWPLRPAPSSPQSRRKSLNDLMENRGHLDSMHLGAQGQQQPEYSQPPYPSSLVLLQSAGRMGPMDNSKASAAHNKTTAATTTTANGSGSSALRIQGQENIKYPSDLGARERSCSNKNLPDLTSTVSSNFSSGSRLRIQPRRASDELAGSSLHNHRSLSSRVSPAASRRSISIINVADGPQPAALLLAGARSVAPSRPGGNVSMVAGQNPSWAGGELGQQSFGDSPVGNGKFNFPTTSTMTTTTTTATRASGSAETQPIGASSSGRRCSLIGVQSLSGYRSQRGSQSGSNELDSPRQLAQPSGGGGGGSSTGPQKRLSQSHGSQQHQSPTGPMVQVAAPPPPGNETRQLQQQRHRGSVAGISQTSSGGASGNGSGATGLNGSRRGSIEQGYQGQRKGSFAMQTLRKLKRTMSLTKGGGGGDQDNEGSNQDSRRSSSTSADSSYDVREDVGIPRKLLAHCKQGSIGKLKLSFILTKGQLEIEVICGQELKFELESSLGVYVKMYLRGGKSRTNKRKTRIVPPTDTPIFKQIIKYDGSLVDNKTLDISVWQKQSALKGKLPIGFTEVQLVELSLEQLLTSWYNLRPMEIACNSSIDE